MTKNIKNSSNSRKIIGLACAPRFGVVYSLFMNQAKSKVKKEEWKEECQRETLSEGVGECFED